MYFIFIYMNVSCIKTFILGTHIMYYRDIYHIDIHIMHAWYIICVIYLSTHINVLCICMHVYTMYTCSNAWIYAYHTHVTCHVHYTHFACLHGKCLYVHMRDKEILHENKVVGETLLRCLFIIISILKWAVMGLQL